MASLIEFTATRLCLAHHIGIRSPTIFRSFGFAAVYCDYFGSHASCVPTKVPLELSQLARAVDPPLVLRLCFWMAQKSHVFTRAVILDPQPYFLAITTISALFPSFVFATCSS